MSISTLIPASCKIVVILGIYGKVKVKLSLSLSKHHAINAQWWNGGTASRTV
jgi:hypothetical protein